LINLIHNLNLFVSQKRLIPIGKIEYPHINLITRLNILIVLFPDFSKPEIETIVSLLLLLLSVSLVMKMTFGICSLGGVDDDQTHLHVRICSIFTSFTRTEKSTNFLSLQIDSFVFRFDIYCQT
jgi:hypothetical protein